jgi:hypothetical protein
LRGGPPRQKNEPPKIEIKREPIPTAKKQPRPTAIQQAAAGDLLSAEKIYQKKSKQRVSQDIRRLTTTPKKSSITPAKKVKIASPELLHSDVVRSLTSQGNLSPEPQHQQISSYINEPFLNIHDHHCDICQDEGSILDPKLPRWCEHLEKEEKGANHEEYGDFDEDADSTAPKEHLRYACEIYFGNTKQLAIIDSGAWSPWMSQKLYIKYGQGSLQPCNGANGADGRSLDVMGEGVTRFVLWGRSFLTRVKV